MGRIDSFRRRIGLVLLLLMLCALPPSAAGRLPTIYRDDDQSGDPGDGVLRPADPQPDARASLDFLLVPVAALPGQPWTLTFRIVRLGEADARPLPSAKSAVSTRRWHRAP